MKSVIKQAIEILEQQRKALKEMDLLGVLLDNEFFHKSNQINTIQLTLSKLLPIEEQQIKKAFNDGCSFEKNTWRYSCEENDRKLKEYFEKPFETQGVIL
jgi:hypothetical protein